MSTSTRIILSNFWISLSASFITAYFSVSFGASFDTNLLWLVLSAFLSTFAIYTFYRQSQKILLWMIPALFAFLVSFTLNALNIIIGINLLLCLLYQTPFSKYPLRNNPWIKPLLIAACWLNTIWLAPLLNYAVPIWESMAQHLPSVDLANEAVIHQFMIAQWKAALANGIAIFCVYYALCLLTDLLQVKEDQKNGFISFPIKYGIKTTFISSVLLFLPILSFSIIHFPYSLFMLDAWGALFWGLAGIFCSVMVYKKPAMIANAFLVDNAIGFCALILLILQLITRLN